MDQRSLGNAIQGDGAAPQIIDVDLGHLVVSLNEHHSVAEVLQAGRDRQLDIAQLPSIASHALL